MVTLLNLIYPDDFANDYVWNSYFKAAERYDSLLLEWFYSQLKTSRWNAITLLLNTKQPLDGPRNTFAVFGKDDPVEKHSVIYASLKLFP